MKAILATEQQIGDIQEASDFQEVKRHLKQQTYSLIIFSLLSTEQPNLSYLKSLKALSGDKPILVLGHEDGFEDVVKSMKIGTHGYMSKCEGSDALKRSVRNLLRGEEHFPGTANKEPVVTRARTKHNLLLSEREAEVLGYVIKGMNNASIAKHINISVRTVENHRANMMRKLDVKNTAELVKKAITDNIVNI